MILYNYHQDTYIHFNVFVASAEFTHMSTIISIMSKCRLLLSILLITLSFSKFMSKNIYTVTVSFVSKYIPVSVGQNTFEIKISNTVFEQIFRWNAFLKNYYNYISLK